MRRVESNGRHDGLVIIYVPCGSDAEAAEIARQLLQRQLIACANIVSSRSLYRWEGQLSDGSEYLLLAKTTSRRAQAAARAAEELHSYDIPCVITLAKADANPSFEKWVQEQVSTSAIEPR
jgi:periplasmic divalent cation tolerance protein